MRGENVENLRVGMTEKRRDQNKLPIESIGI